MGNAEKHRALATEALERANRALARVGEKHSDRMINSNDPYAYAIALDNEAKKSFARHQAKAASEIIYKTCERGRCA
jgi:hypothetical protein